ncbi:MAG: hypothetical protein MRJ96_07695 [Nitrospirales bacterium]|nr:hypothetical protein [Nitrospira sp.]MDR4501316.1 hypothetical protein [Nitrospirales bacterium]
MRGQTIFPVFILCCWSILATVSSGLATETSVKAMATWQAQGLITQVEEDKALMVGVLAGVMFIEEGKGKLDAAGLLCPGSVETNLETQVRVGSGRCIITDKEGDKVYAQWSCRGNEHGCKGPFNLVGGTGKFFGISGKNSVVFRIAMRIIANPVSPDSFQQIASGLALWPNLQYTLPR